MMRRLRAGACALVLASGAATVSVPPAGAQSGSDDTRALIPREYAKQIETKITERRPRKKKVARRRPAAGYTPAKDEGLIPRGAGEDVGVTLWRLREPKAGDGKDAVEVQRIAKRVNGAVVESDAKMTPERVVAEAPLSDGDLFRISIEVPFACYIYLMNREKYSDGTVRAGPV